MLKFKLLAVVGICYLIVSCNSVKIYNGLNVALIAVPPSENIAVAVEKLDTRGNTSVANDNEDLYKWSGNGIAACESWGYFTQEGLEIPYIKRDRDLGQTFEIIAGTDVLLKSITVMTGFGSNVVRPGTYGQPMALQIFEVSGNPVVNDNGSPANTEALHGFPHDRQNLHIEAERDDYWVGEKYKSVVLLTGANFPSPAEFRLNNTDSLINPDHQQLKGRLLQFSLDGDFPVVLHKNRKYAFLIMLVNRADNNGFTLANAYKGDYQGGHGIRRDGNGSFPPVKCDPAKDFHDKANLKAYKSAHFPASLEKRAKIQPGTNGYPDVDTWRDLVFYIETKNTQN